MRSFIIFSALFAIAHCGGAPYSFGYATADGQTRQESGVGGAVQGSYSYIDANGDLRKVAYVADAFGYRPIGDTGIDRGTAIKQAAINAYAPAGTLTNGVYAAPIAVAAPVAVAAAAPVGYGYGLGYGAGIAHGYAGYGLGLGHLGGGLVAAPAHTIGYGGYSVHTPTHTIKATY
jgi:hypothetical protein